MKENNLKLLLKQKAILILFVTSLFFSCDFVAFNLKTIPIIEGQTDISEMGFNNYPVIKLNGEWGFTDGLYQSINQISPDSLRYVSVPSTWNSYYSKSGFGAGTFFLTIKKNKIDSNISIKLTDTSSSYRIFINGIECGSSGIVADNKTSYIPKYKSQFLIIPELLIKNNDKLEIAIQVANFSHARGGLWEPVLIGTTENIIKYRDYRVFTDFFLVGGLLLMILYHFAVFFFRKMDKTPLFLGLFCLILFFRTMVTGERIISGLFNFDIILRIEYITTFLPVPFFLSFVFVSFNSLKYNIFLKTAYYTLVHLGFVFSIFPVILPPSLFTQLIYVFYGYFLLSAMFIIIVSIKSLINKLNGSKTFIVGLIIVIGTAANDILYNMQILKNTALLIPYGIYLFVFIQSVILAKKFSLLFYKNQVLSIKLENRNTELEKATVELDNRLEEINNRHFTDKMTNLPNRNSLFIDIGNFDLFSLILLDINSFKEINDYYGNRVGDEVLKEVSIRLKSVSDQTADSQLYKLSADEFSIITRIKHINQSEDHLLSMIDKIISEINDKSYIVFDLEIFIQITIGAALSLDRNEGAEKALQKADMALKRAKQKRKHFLVYDESMQIVKEIEENMKRLNMIRTAIKEDAIIPIFQPIFNNHTLTIDKYECLARINDNGTIVTPDRFLELSKKNRYYHEITSSIFKKSLNAFKNNKFEFSINISIDDIISSGTIDMISKALKYFPGGCERIIFEILESEGIDNYSLVNEFITFIRRFGCRIAIDDFGSGYSNFDHILQLSVDYIKIDSSLIKNIDNNRNSQVIVKTISGFAKELKLKTVAEFVHNEEVYKKSFDLGIDYSQGYYFGKPDFIIGS